MISSVSGFLCTLQHQSQERWAGAHTGSIDGRIPAIGNAEQSAGKMPAKSQKEMSCPLLSSD